MKKNINITKEFKVVEKEAGSIPMTGYNFSKHNKSTLLHIGTSGGWTKASTGFTFKKSTNKIENLILYLNHRNMQHFRYLLALKINVHTNLLKQVEMNSYFFE